MSKIEAYKELRKRVDAGTLRIIADGGVSRGLTSIFTKVFGEGLFGEIRGRSLFDILAHEPFLQLDNRLREDGVWGAILKTVRAKERELLTKEVNLQHDPIRMLVKNNSFHLTPQEWELFLPLVDKGIISIRNPALTFLSISKALCKMSNQLFDDPATQNRLSEALATSDFSNLLPDDAPLWNFHSILGEAGMQNQIWEDAGFNIDYYGQYLGTPPHKMASLPEDLQAPFRFRRLAWRELPSVQQRFINAGIQYAIVDATDLQLDPDYNLDLLRNFLGLEPMDSAVRPSARFDPGSEGTPNFLLYERVSKSFKIEPPTQQPVPMDKFPDFLKSEMERAYAIYLMLSQRPERLRDKNRAAFSTIDTEVASGKSLQIVDPVFSYMRMLIDGDVSSRERIAATIRANRPEFEHDYSAIDRALKQNRQASESRRISSPISNGTAFIH